jgi:membrane protein YqaA with SNARE-associated domain
MHHLLEIWFGWVLHGGYFGIIVLMAMESSIFPVPSEIVIPPAAFLAAEGHLSFIGVILAGTFGSYLGAAITYWVSLAIGRPFIHRFGKYFFIPPEKLERSEVWLRRYEAGGVFFSRPLPVIRHLGFQRGHDRWFSALVHGAGLFRRQSFSRSAGPDLESRRLASLHQSAVFLDCAFCGSSRSSISFDVALVGQTGIERLASRSPAVCIRYTSVVLLLLRAAVDGHS